MGLTEDAGRGGAVWGEGVEATPEGRILGSDCRAQKTRLGAVVQDMVNN